MVPAWLVPCTSSAYIPSKTCSPPHPCHPGTPWCLGLLCVPCRGTATLLPTPWGHRALSPVASWGCPAWPLGWKWWRSHLIALQLMGMGHPQWEVLWGHCTGDSSCPCSPGWRPRGPSPPRPPTPGKRSGLREAGGCSRMGTGKGLGCCHPCPSQSHAAPASSCELPLPATPMLAPCAKQGGQDPAIVLHGDVHRMVPHQEKLSGGPPFAPSWQDRLLLVSPRLLVLPAHHSPREGHGGWGQDLATVAWGTCPHPITAAVPSHSAPPRPPPTPPGHEGTEPKCFRLRNESLRLGQRCLPTSGANQCSLPPGANSTAFGSRRGHRSGWGFTAARRLVLITPK